MRFGLVSQVLIGALLCTPLMADALRPTQELELRLRDALFRGESPSPQTNASLILLLRKHESGWKRAWGVARDIGVSVLESKLK